MHGQKDQGHQIQNYRNRKLYSRWVIAYKSVIIIHQPMGLASSQEIHPHSNENFLSMTAQPQENTLVVTTYIHSPISFTTWASSLLKLGNLEKSPLLLPRQFKILSRRPCGEQSLLQIKYDCFYISFQEEIDRRTNEEKHFEEEELWYLLLTLAEAAAGSHQFQAALGDLKPSNLLLNKDGQIKLLGKLSLPCFEDAFDKESPTSSLYSPQELQSRSKAYKVNKNNYVLSESFSMGMTMLAAGALSKVSNLYNYKENSLDLVEFNKLIKYWQEFSFYSQLKKETIEYSKQLKQIVMNLLVLESTKRMASLEVHNILKNYKAEIMALQKFTIDQRYFGEVSQSRVSKPKTHQLRSRQRSEHKQSLSSSIMVHSFNNSHEVSFQAPMTVNSPSEFVSRASSSSNKRKLSVTGCFQGKLNER